MTGGAVTFVATASLQHELTGALSLKRELVPVEGTRTVGRSAMVLNDEMLAIDVDPEPCEARAAGESLTCEPATVLPLAQRYFLY